MVFGGAVAEDEWSGLWADFYTKRRQVRVSQLESVWKNSSGSVLGVLFQWLPIWIKDVGAGG